MIIKVLFNTKNVNIHFTLRKSKTSLLDFSTNRAFDLVYFDAFNPAMQPELWTQEIFENLFSMLSPKGFLVTYSSKWKVRRAMQTTGFTVEKLKGPAGKRAMVKATKKHQIWLSNKLLQYKSATQPMPNFDPTPGNK
jgi:tRNA U34 5-methylaminomethyl-2-thiouridine-forming methyltransferase MnmC